MNITTSRNLPSLIPLAFDQVDNWNVKSLKTRYKTDENNLLTRTKEYEMWS